MSVLATTKHSLCNCIDTWQTGCIFIVKKKKKKQVFGGLAGQSRFFFFMQDILYQGNAVLFLWSTIKN